MVTFTLQAQNLAGGWNYITSQGSTSFTWSAQYGYKALQVYARNAYGTTYSNVVGVYIFNYPQTSITSTVYDSGTSTVVGEYAPGVSFNEPGTVTQYFNSAQTDIPIYVGTIANWNNSYAIGIRSFKQALTLYGSYGFTPGVGSGTNVINFDVTNVQNSIQTGSSNQIMVYLLDYLTGIANHFSYGLIPPPGLLFNTFGGQTSYTSPTPIPVYFNDTGGNVYPAKRVPEYFPIYEGILSSTPIRDFGIKTWNDEISANSQTNFQLFLEYTCSVAFLESSQSSATFASTSTLIFQINVAAAS